ncbi:MAG: ABC transporter substrate-binding protein [Rhodobacteraceae bacterium]|nr:ABC transporter substrate-binding protein [Paracoccaceae bacterium]
MMNISRRGLLKTGAAAGVLSATGLPTYAAPNKGGTLKLGFSGANTSDSWDGRTHSDLFMQAAGHGCVFDCLTEIKADGSLAGELAESWESSSDSTIWTFNLRKGVTFHNGKDFGADDVIESLQLHVSEDSKSAMKPIVANIASMKKNNSHQIELTLTDGNADLPFLLADYHMLIYPAGMVVEATAKGIGTGLYRNDGFDSGVRFVGSRYADHYKGDSAGYFDSVEIIAINDASARMNALMTGQVHAVNRVDFKTEPLLKANPAVEIFEVTGNQHYTFPMLTGVDPFTNLKVRQALKHAVDREEMVAKILQGHGAVGNDHPIGPANAYYAADLPQNDFDPDKAKFLLEEAGLRGLSVDLSTSNAAFPGANDASQLYQASAKAAGININIVQEPADGYWSNVWLKKSWCSCFWSGRATEDLMFSVAYEAGGPWNDTQWNHARFQELLVKGRTESDTARRREIYTEMQDILRVEGGVVVPMYANWVDAHSTKITNGGAPFGNVYQADSGRIAERWWFK